MKKLKCFIVVLVSLMALQPCMAERVASKMDGEATKFSYSSKKLSDWSFILDQLRNDGISSSLVSEVFGDPRFPKHTNIPFAAAPKESKRIYKGFYSKKNIAAAKSFLVKHQAILNRSEARYGVGRENIAALLLIESHYGKVTGKYNVANRLARVASAAEPKNVTYNYKRLKKDDPKLTFKEIEERAKYLNDLFYPELRILLKLHAIGRLDARSLKGSRAGAFGIPQFLPSSFAKFGVDGNGDGKVSLYDMEDAVFSASNYLASFGWRDSLSIAEKGEVIWHYNHSDAYVDTVLGVAALLG